MVVAVTWESLLPSIGAEMLLAVRWYSKPRKRGERKR